MWLRDMFGLLRALWRADREYRASMKALHADVERQVKERGVKLAAFEAELRSHEAWLDKKRKP